MTTRKICGANKKRGGICGSWILFPNGRCKAHGGRALSGPAHPNWKDGGRSKYMPQRLLERYGEALQDTELLSLRGDLALVESRIAEQLRRVDEGDSSAYIRRLQETWRAYERVARQRTGPTDAERAEKARRMQDALDEHGRAVRAAGDYYAAWADVDRLMAQRQRLAESEQRREISARLMLSIPEATAIGSQFANIVREHVHDRDALAAIWRDFARLYGRLDPQLSSATRGDQ